VSELVTEFPLTH